MGDIETSATAAIKIRLADTDYCLSILMREIRNLSGMDLYMHTKINTRKMMI